MGNTSKKLAAKCTLLTREEQKYVAATFRTASKNSERIREEDLIVSGKLDAVSLEKFWGPQIDPRLAQYLTNFLFGSGQQKAQSVDFNRFAELYVYNVRGTVEERVIATYNCLGMDYSEDAELPYQLLKEYCESIVSTYIKMVKGGAGGAGGGGGGGVCAARGARWLEKGFRAGASQVQALGEAAAASVGPDLEAPHHVCTAHQLTKWLQSNILLRQLAELVFETLYGVSRRGEDAPAPPPSAPSLIPAPDGLEAMPDYPAFTDLSHVVWINSHLPQQHRHRWRFLFSTHIHGESFSTMTGRIIDQGPSIIIVEDASGYIFGGYAPAAWAFGPAFTGGDESFLFSCAPRMRVYPATGYNDHYQYLNHHTKTLPNGLLMGGQFNFGAIWVPAEPFGEGACAESCSTYRGYRRLSKEPTFHIRSLEVWGVGDKPCLDKDEDERDTSILDTNPEAKAILDMAGRTRHSEGLREQPPL